MDVHICWQFIIAEFFVKVCKCGQLGELRNPHLRRQLKTESCSNKIKCLLLSLWLMFPVYPTKMGSFYLVILSLQNHVIHSQARSCKNCCSRKAISITYSESMCIALGTQHAMRMRHIVLCGLSGCTLFFRITS